MKKILALVAVVALVAFAAPAIANVNPFMDVPMNHWAYDAIGQLAARGVLSGYPDGTYKGNQPTTRYEMASALARALAVVDMTKASKQDVEMLKKLVVEFKDELDALGVKVDKLDSRVAVLEDGVGGWKISGSFRMDWKWADRAYDPAGSTYAQDGDQDLTMRTPSNYLQLVKRIDDKVSYRARLRRTDTQGLQWTENFITVKFPDLWDTTMKFGRSDSIVWENGLFHGSLGDDAWFLDDRIEGIVLDKNFAMGNFSALWGHYDTVNGSESTWYGARVRFNFNEQFNMGLNALVKDYDDNPTFDLPVPYNGTNTVGVEKWSTYWFDFGVNFNPNVALRGMYAMNKYDFAGGTPAGWDDSPNAYKVIVDVKQDALKFTSLWLEYAKLDAHFATHINGLSYAEQAAGLVKPAFLIDKPWRPFELKYWMIAAEQKWNDKWATFQRYLDVDYDTAIGDLLDHTNWLFGVRYMYTSALQFELMYDKIEADNVNYSDHMIRFRTSISF
jgi:hypothetical protein